jgi:hypothetical protein
MGWEPPAGRIIGHGSVPPRGGAVPGSVCIDVTEAVQRWQRLPLEAPVVYLFAPRVRCRFHGEDSAEPALRPAVQLLTPRGIEMLPCAVDAEHPGSTVLHVDQRGGVALNFSTPDPSAHILSARLVLALKEHANPAPEPIYATEPAPGPLAALAGKDLWADTDLYFRTAAIGADPQSDSAYERNLRYQVTHPAIWKRVTWEEEDGAPFLRIGWDRTKRSGSFKIPVFRAGSTVEGRTVAFQYDVRVAENFAQACTDGGKFPGFCSSGARYTTHPSPWPGEPDGRRGEIIAGNGGGNVHGDDGWSARGGYLRGYSLKTREWSGAIPLHTYSYHLARKVDGHIELWHEALRRYEEEKGLRGRGYTVQGGLRRFLEPGEVLAPAANPTGARLHWDYAGTDAAIAPGSWHTIAQVMHINDPDGYDGRLDAFLDGRQVAKIEGMRWRATRSPLIPNSTLGIGAAWFNFYHGGLGFPVAETYIDVRRVAVKVLEWDEP